MSTVTLVARLLLATVFATAGASKLSKPAASRATFNEFGAWPQLVRIGSVALAPSELAVAAGLIFVPSARWGGVAAALLLVLFILGIANALQHGRRPNCGCFGALRPTPIGTSTLARNGLLLAVALLVVSTAPGPGLDQWFGRHTAAEIVLMFAAVAALLAGVIYLPAGFDHGRNQPITFGSTPLLTAGQDAPEFTAADTDGTPRTLQSLYRDELPLVLVFGSTTCSSCRELFPHLARWQNSLAERLRIAVIVAGDLGDARSISVQYGLEEVLCDPQSDVSSAYGISWSPAAFSLTRAGRISNGPATGPDAIEELLRLTLRRDEPMLTPWTQTTSVA